MLPGVTHTQVFLSECETTSIAVWLPCGCVKCPLVWVWRGRSVIFLLRVGRHMPCLSWNGGFKGDLRTRERSGGEVIIFRFMYKCFFGRIALGEDAYHKVSLNWKMLFHSSSKRAAAASFVYSGRDNIRQGWGERHTLGRITTPLAHPRDLLLSLQYHRPYVCTPRTLHPRHFVRVS